jgi:hypothetical protein
VIDFTICPVDKSHRAEVCLTDPTRMRLSLGEIANFSANSAWRIISRLVPGTLRWISGVVAHEIKNIRNIGKRPDIFFNTILVLKMEKFWAQHYSIFRVMANHQSQLSVPKP